MTTALTQIAQAQADLNKTWSSGNVVAGLASIVPQTLLSGAAWSLTTWQSSIAGAQASITDTVGVPVAHQIAELALLGTLMLPAVAGIEMNAAAQLIPLVGLLGASGEASAAAAQVGNAQKNGQVYAVVPFLVYGQNEITYISVNGGKRIPVEIDSGSSALTLTQQYAGNLGPALPGGPYDSGYGSSTEGVNYQFYLYPGAVDFGNGLVTGAGTLLNIPTTATQQAYNNYQYGDGIVGVLGIGANTGEKGISPIRALPGELGYGALEWRFGSWGVMLLGPNPLPARASVSGAPITNVNVQINGGPMTQVKTYIDSGGVYGEVPAFVVGTGQTSGQLPAGTRISVYTADGKTLLYSYTTTDTNTPTVAGNDEPFNTGIEPYQQGPMYTSYGPSGQGTTSFDIF